MNLLVKATATALGTATLVLGGIGTANAVGNLPATGQPSPTIRFRRNGLPLPRMSRRSRS